MPWPRSAPLGLLPGRSASEANRIATINIPPHSGGYFSFGHSPNNTGGAQVRFLLACQPCTDYLLPVNGSPLCTPLTLTPPCHAGTLSRQPRPRGNGLGRPRLKMRGLRRVTFVKSEATRCASHAFHQPKIHRLWLVFLGCHGKSYQKRPLKPMVSKLPSRGFFLLNISTFSHANWYNDLSGAKCGIASASPPLSRLPLQNVDAVTLLNFIYRLSFFEPRDYRAVFFIQKRVVPHGTTLFMMPFSNRSLT